MISTLLCCIVQDWFSPLKRRAPVMTLFLLQSSIKIEHGGGIGDPFTPNPDALLPSQLIKESIYIVKRSKNIFILYWCEVNYWHSIIIRGIRFTGGLSCTLLRLASCIHPLSQPVEPSLSETSENSPSVLGGGGGGSQGKQNPHLNLRKIMWNYCL